MGGLETYTEQCNGSYVSPYEQAQDYWSWFHIAWPYSVSSYQKEEFNFEVNFNSEGLRDVDDPLDKPNNEYRIIALGDSYTEGVGAAISETWFNVLEKNMNNHATDTSFHINVINGGKSGSDPFFCYVLLKERLINYQPDMVILAMNTSDVMDVVVRGGMERFQPDGKIRFKDPPAIEWLFRYSFITRYVMLNIFEYDWYQLTPEQQKTECSRSVDLLISSIQLFEKLARENRFHFVVVLHPVIDEYNTNEYSYGFWRIKENQPPTHLVDMLTYFANSGKINDDNKFEYFWEIDRHYTPKGYALFAEGIEKTILEKQLVSLRDH